MAQYVLEQSIFSKKGNLFNKVIFGILFFFWGMLTQTNEIMAPYFKQIAEFSYFQALLLQFTFFMTYLVVSYPAAKLIDNIGYKKSIFSGLVIVSLGCFTFYPAAAFQHYYSILFALFVVAAGLTILQIAANTYVVLQSEEGEKESNLNFIQGFNSLARVMALIFGTALFLSLAGMPSGNLSVGPDEYREQISHFVQISYLTLAVIIFFIAVIFYNSRIPEFTTNDLMHSVKGGRNFKYVLHFRHTVLAAVAIFAYVGAEVAIGSNLVRYLTSAEIGAMLPEKKALNMVQYYWASAMVGRFIGAFVLKDISARKLVGTFAIGAACCTIISVLTGGKVAVGFMLSVGFFNSILFPSIFSMGIKGLGNFSEEGASLLIASVVGGAIIPLILVYLQHLVGFQYAFLLPAACYLYVVYYGFKGSKFEPVPESEERNI